MIIDNLIPKLEELSKQKYGSNVLEKVNNVNTQDYIRLSVIVIFR